MAGYKNLKVKQTGAAWYVIDQTGPGQAAYKVVQGPFTTKQLADKALSEIVRWVPCATDYRYKVDLDPDPASSLDHLEQWDTQEKYAGNEFMEDGRAIPFGEYIRKWGNPDNYTVLYVERQVKCNLGGWHRADALYGIDFYQDVNSYQYVGTYYNIDAIPNEYLREVARDLTPSEPKE